MPSVYDHSPTVFLHLGFSSLCSSSPILYLGFFLCLNLDLNPRYILFFSCCASVLESTSPQSSFDLSLFSTACSTALHSSLCSSILLHFWNLKLLFYCWLVQLCVLPLIWNTCTICSRANYELIMFLFHVTYYEFLWNYCLLQLINLWI